MADKIEDGGPAFPTVDGPPSEYLKGMSLRDWFAGQALAGHYADWGSYSMTEIVTMAYTMADAMIKARKGEL